MIVACESCGTQLQVGDELAGKQVTCANCGYVLTTPAAPTPPVVQPAIVQPAVVPPAQLAPVAVSAPSAPAAQSADDIIAAAKQKIMLPAIFMMVLGALNCLQGALFALFGFASMVSPSNVGAAPSDRFVASLMGVYLVLCGIFFIVTGYRMMRLKNYILCMVGSIVAIMPCLTACYIFPIAMGFGIFALVMLMQPSVKKGFELSVNQ